MHNFRVHRFIFYKLKKFNHLYSREKNVTIFVPFLNIYQITRVRGACYTKCYVATKRIIIN